MKQAKPRQTKENAPTGLKMPLKCEYCGGCGYVQERKGQAVHTCWICMGGTKNQLNQEVKKND